MAEAMTENEPVKSAHGVASRLLNDIGPLVVSTGAITALLYYFGYVRERALFSYFGIDLGVLEFTSNDYVLRSSQAIFFPLATGLLLGVLALFGHQAFMTWTHHRTPKHWRTGWILLAALSVCLLAVGVAGLYIRWQHVGPRASSLALGTGACLLYYATWMAMQDVELPDSLSRALTDSVWPRRILLGALALTAAFWWTANVAVQNGQATAVAIQKNLGGRQEAVVLSTEPLGDLGTGVYIEELTEEAGYRFRYTGLRVLLHTGDQWVLLARGWTPENGDTITLILDDTAGIRIDVRP